MGMSVGQEGVPLIECWMQHLLHEHIRKEENLDLLDPTLSQFPQPRLWYLVSLQLFTYNIATSYFIQVNLISLSTAELY